MYSRIHHNYTYYNKKLNEQSPILWQLLWFVLGDEVQVASHPLKNSGNDRHHFRECRPLLRFLLPTLCHHMISVEVNNKTRHDNR